MADHSMLSPHGYAVWTPKEGGRSVESDTACCCHCGEHVYIGLALPGMPLRRCGYCLNCGARTCGKESCDPCINRFQKLENVEQGRPLDYKPIIVAPGFGT